MRYIWARVPGTLTGEASTSYMVVYTAPVSIPTTPLVIAECSGESNANYITSLLNGALE